MPPAGPRLTPEEIQTIREWIDAGAPIPEVEPLVSEGGAKDEPKHWAFRPIRKPAPPVVQTQDWARNPIDAFILATIEAT